MAARANKAGKGRPSIHVTVAWLDGKKESGWLNAFSPLLRALDLRTDDGRSIAVDTGKLAYVGFLREADRKVRVPKLANLIKVRVTTVTHDVFLVWIRENEMNPAGFHAFPAYADDIYEHIYFYHPGVVAIESAQPLGSLLVEKKLASPSEVEQALDRQRESQVPLGHILLEHGRLDEKELEESLVRQHRQQIKLGELLVETGRITPEDLERALAEQRKRHSKKLGEILIEMGLITEEKLASALSVKFHLPFIDLDDYPINPAAAAELEEELIRRYQVLPIDVDEHTLTVAMADPLNIEAYDAIRFRTQKHLRQVIAVPSQIRRYIEEHFDVPGEDERLEIERLRTDEEDGEEPELDKLALKASKAPPIVRLVNHLILEGLRRNASDIHILPQPGRTDVAYRVNGELRHETSLDKMNERKVIARIKILAGMDVTVHRLPQDGRMSVRYRDMCKDFRVSCIPNAYGESMVMRVLNKEMAMDLASLGLRDEDARRLGSLMARPFGLILATGPTGSGKSTTLFALLKSIIERPLHILTIEDPVESQIPGANQIQVNAKIGLTFSRILRNVLRHDPDVIMVGEMRDQETAEIGIQAALTGHLMLSTLHTNTAVDTIIRLVDLGIPAYLLAPALIGVISQNLVKRLCPDCRQQVAVDEETAMILRGAGLEAPSHLYEARGCQQCGKTGFIGRAMVYEFLEVNDEVRRAIHDGLVGQDLQRVAEDAGMHPKARHAYDLAREGIICRADLIRLLV